MLNFYGKMDLKTHCFGGYVSNMNSKR